MRACFVDGEWRAGGSDADVVVSSTADGAELARCTGANAADADAAVRSARAAWSAWSTTPVEDRVAVLAAAADLLEKRSDEIAESCALEIGTPLKSARMIHGQLPLAAMRDVLVQVGEFPMEEHVGSSLVVREPAGVVVAITAWNYPLYQFATKVVPALAAGCTVVAKPSELAPLSAVAFFESLAEAGLPPGVADLLVGTGPEAGEPLVVHPGVDVVSFTGSTTVGTRISEVAAPGVKKVALELGGKSASILLDDADLDHAVPGTVSSWLINNSQTCAALTRLIVPRTRLAEVEQRLLAVLGDTRVGHPMEEATDVGPMVSSAQRDRVVSYIETGIRHGSRLLVGGVEPPAGLPHSGNYVRPTVLTDVAADQRVAQEEIFGPVLCVIPVDSEDEAVEVANGTPYGLSGAVWSADRDRALAIARRLRTGQVAVNGGSFNIQAPFGGYGRSGIGREGGRFGLAEFYEIKAIQL